jgi:hypothetical protein
MSMRYLPVTHVVRHRMLACILALSAISCGSAVEVGTTPVLWNDQSLGTAATVTGGKLTIRPADADWGASAVVSRTVIPFWATGAKVRLHITPDLTKDGGNLDGIVTIGFISSATVDRVQGADHFIGVNLAFTKARNQCYIKLARKETNGAEAVRGDQWGNPVNYADDKGLTIPAQAFDLILTMNGTTVSAAVTGAGEVSQPHGLQQSNWTQPYLVVQAMQFNTGRMSVDVTEAGSAAGK